MGNRDSIYRLSDWIEVDDAFVGGEHAGMRGRGAQGKTPVLVACETREEKAGFIAMKAIEKVDSESVKAFAVENLHEDQYIATDAYPSLTLIKLKAYSIKFRPNKPGYPHLNGKVEGSKKTDKTEFYVTVDLSDANLDELLAEWQLYYNWDRPHSAHHGKSPMERYFKLAENTPYSDEAYEGYTPGFERIQDPNYKVDLELRRLKRCL